jgi:hypothetical protein
VLGFLKNNVTRILTQATSSTVEVQNVARICYSARQIHKLRPVYILTKSSLKDAEAGNFPVCVACPCADFDKFSPSYDENFLFDDFN